MPASRQTKKSERMACPSCGSARVAGVKRETHVVFDGLLFYKCGACGFTGYRADFQQKRDVETSLEDRE